MILDFKSDAAVVVVLKLWGFIFCTFRVFPCRTDSVITWLLLEDLICAVATFLTWVLCWFLLNSDPYSPPICMPSLGEMNSSTSGMKVWIYG